MAPDTMVGAAARIDRIDLVTGLAVTSVGVAIILLLPAEVGGATFAAVGNMTSPALFAALSGMALVLLGVALAGRSLMRRTPCTPFVVGQPLRVLAASGVLVAGVAGTFVVGLLPSAAAIVILLGLVFGYRRYWLLVLIGAVCPIVVYVLFERMLLVLLPRGWF